MVRTYNVSTTTVFVRYEMLHYCNLLCYVKCATSLLTTTVSTTSQLERRVREGHNKARAYVHTYVGAYTLVPSQHILHKGHKTEQGQQRT